MIKIIKESKTKIILSTKRFVCNFCGCIFEADNKDYKVGEQYNAVYYSCECPSCAKTAYVNN